MILTTEAKSRRHFPTLRDVNTQFKPRDLLADCVYSQKRKLDSFDADLNSQKRKPASFDATFSSLKRKLDSFDPNLNIRKRFFFFLRCKLECSKECKVEYSELQT